MKKRKDFVDLSNRQFGRWFVLSYAETRGALGAYWNCKCECGTLKTVRGQSLSGGKSQSCGCYKAEVDNLKVQQHFLKHGHAKREAVTRTYSIWSNMLRRCLDPKCPAYPRYGGRGICVSIQWLRYENFLADMGEPPSKEYSLDRKNNNGHYEPKNCRWATAVEQMNNKRNNVILEFEGQRKTIAQWAREKSINYFTLHYRLNEQGLDIGEALTGTRHT